MPAPVPFELQPLLEGELLTLRPIRPDDFDALFAVAADPLIWEQHPVHDRHTEPRFREFFQGALDSRGAFVVLDRRDGRMIGSSRYHGWDAERSEVEIGWTFLARRYWGGTYNGEMKRLMLDHAFRFVERVVFLVGEENIRSQKAVERIGGVRAGTRREGTEERVVFEITRAAWAARRPPAPPPAAADAPAPRSDRPGR